MSDQSPEIVTKIKDFFKSGLERSFAANEVLISANQAPQGIFYLQSGLVRQYSLSMNGNEQTLNIYKPGAFFPMMWAVNHIANTYYFEALTPVRVKIMAPDQVVSFLKAEPEVMFDLVSRLYSGVHGLLGRLELALGGDAHHKLLQILIMTAERHGKNVGSDMLLPENLTESFIATQAGLSRETVSRLMHQFKELGLVTFKRSRLESVKLAALQELMSLS